MSPDALVDAIRAAMATDASAEVRQAGVMACRALLAVLEARPGEPIVAANPTTALPPIAQVVGALRDVPADQLLDMVIGRLRAALPTESASPTVQPVTFQLVRLPTIRRG